MIALALRNDDLVLLNVKSLGIRVRDRLRSDITRLTIKLQRKVKEEKLTGQVLHVRTGRLRRNINRRMAETATSITGQVGTNVSYAAIHEYGFTGVVNVREHLRMQSVVFGRPITPTAVTVRAHAMRMHMPERSFLRSALAEMRPEIVTTLQQGLREATA